jgi:hypothetical protein
MRTPAEVKEFVARTAAANQRMVELTARLAKTSELHDRQLAQLIANLQKARQLIGCKKSSTSDRLLKDSKPITEHIN